MSAPDPAKLAAARAALDLVEPGMVLGLGTGSTAALFVDALGQRVAEGLAVTGVPTSSRTRAQAERLAIPLADLDGVGRLDLTVDGADEIGPGLTLIKGGGGALLQEKIVAANSARFAVIADASKLVDALGTFALPVEIVRFGAASTARRIADLTGVEGRLRRAGDVPVLTDEGHYLLDLAMGRIEDPAALERVLAGIPGVVESGLFTDLASVALVGAADGTVRRIDARPG